MVKVYVVPAANPETEPEVPEPEAEPEGLPVTVQVPLLGNPLKATDAVAVAQVGCVIVPIVGALGSAFTVLEEVATFTLVAPELDKTIFPE